jgi:16S rRNA (adenine1518-N6/adenine1519-N6)-dimethyltransferase
MTDLELLNRIVEAANITKKDIVLEIGAGTGNLTKFLAEKGKKIEVIEKDKELFKQLKKNLENFRNVSYMHDNAMKVKFPEFNKCVSNLPYNLCESLLWKFTRYKFDSLTFVVPKSFTELLLGKEKSRLIYLVEAYYNVEYLEDVYPDSFEPQPKVVSALIRITPKKTNNFLRKLLSQYDKKTKNALREILMENGMTKQQATEKVSLMVRPRIQNKNIVNLSLFELETILKRFER